jgi:hypothetical protein
MSDNYPPGMTERDWAHVNGEGESPDGDDEGGAIDPSEDDTSPFRGHYNNDDD